MLCFLGLLLCMLTVNTLVFINWLTALHVLEPLLCVLLMVIPLFFLDWLVALRFLELCCFSTVSSHAQAGRVTLAVGCCSTLLMSGAASVMESVLHDRGGTPGGCLTSLGCGGGSMLLLVNTEYSGRLVP
jgi:hypothetical protein